MCSSIKPLYIQPFSDEHKYRLLKLIEVQPDISQRKIAGALGVSLGKVNFCIRALMEKGWIKAVNFKNSRRRAAYLYQLTPAGLEAKARITLRFLQQKMAEYEQIQEEIAALEAEVQATTHLQGDFNHQETSTS